MSGWRYVKNGQACGPVEIGALQAMLNHGSLGPETLVWKEGMANWAAAQTLPELQTSPPLVDPVPPIPPGAMDAAAGPVVTDAQKNKAFAILAYIWVLFLVPLLVAPQSKFARYHANQGLVLFLASLVVRAIGWVFPQIPYVGQFLGHVPLTMLLGVGLLVLMILGIVNAASGQCKPLPLIGHFQLLK